MNDFNRFIDFLGFPLCFKIWICALLL
jgi:hypothetical protein